MGNRRIELTSNDESLTNHHRVVQLWEIHTPKNSTFLKFWDDRDWQRLLGAISVESEDEIWPLARNSHHEGDTTSGSPEKGCLHCISQLGTRVYPLQ